MLSSAYFLAKFRFDTAENEPAKNLQKIAKFANFALSRLGPLWRGRAAIRTARGRTAAASVDACGQPVAEEQSAGRQAARYAVRVEVEELEVGPGLCLF